MLREKLYTSRQVAKMLSLTAGRIRQICRWNRVGTKVGRDWMLTEKDVATLRNEENRKKLA